MRAGTASQGADSGFVEVGSARKARQSGNTFTITPPRPGAAPYLLRGVVTFEWREADEVVRHARGAPGGPPEHGRLGPGRLQLGNLHDHLTRCPPLPMNHP